MHAPYEVTLSADPARAVAAVDDGFVVVASWVSGDCGWIGGIARLGKFNGSREVADVE
jgi:hypothetical protein